MGVFSDLDIFIQEVSKDDDVKRQELTSEINKYIQNPSTIGFQKLSLEAQGIIENWAKYEYEKERK